MSKTILFALSILSATASACPNLQGAWSCTNPGHPTQMLIINQQLINGATNYAIGSSMGSPQTLIADGQDHIQQDTTAGSGGVQTTNAVCADDTHVSAKVNLHADVPAVNMTGTFNYTLVSPTALTAVADVTYTVNGQSGHEVQSLSCTHN